MNNYEYLYTKTNENDKKWGQTPKREICYFNHSYSEIKHYRFSCANAFEYKIGSYK